MPRTATRATERHGMDGDPTTLAAILAGEPSAPAWQQAWPLLERAPADLLAEAAASLRAWPPHLRPMPDHWWQRYAAGQVEPWHALAAWRRLGDLEDVQNGQPALAEPDDEADSFAYFYHGATSVACPGEPRWLVVCAAAEWHHNGGDIVVWGAAPQVPSRMLLDGAHFHDEALDTQLSPDGTIMVTSVEGRVHAWRVPDGTALWQLNLGPNDDDDFFDTERTTVRVGFSADGSRVAAGSAARGVRVLNPHTGEVLLEVAADPLGAVALDGEGRRLAHAGRDGEILIRDTGSGTVVLRHGTGLTRVNALAYAADGSGLLVAGGVRDDAEDAPVTPAAVLVTLDGDAVAGQTPVRPQGVPGKLTADSPLATVCTRAVWGQCGPLVYTVDDGGSALFDGHGRTLWTESEMTMGNFSADGRVLVTVSESINVVFLDALPPAAR
ncbi:WD40 repeat domain-containing protein [Catellatospora tritici]|uniref:WD40 repeat domain-containing protein n=1 Tax=Catellatospora tritici TaxID=2851566 RepID=UPI001C2D964F|nr:WD40 repeat domain-containing protein [Catellatospora tritici]MBV1851812.1 WD40 repeat domain-containing protein [Catellatospora tritici]